MHRSDCPGAGNEPEGDDEWPFARHLHSALTTSAACCGRRALLAAREEFAAGDDHGRGAARRRGRGDPRRRADAGGRRPAGGDRRGVPPRRPGTWTSSTSSTAISKAEREHQRPVPQRRAGRSSSHPPALHVDGARRARRARSSAPTSRTCSSVVTTATPKLTIPSPSMVHYRGGRAAIDKAVYPDLDAVLDAT